LREESKGQEEGERERTAGGEERDDELPRVDLLGV
jgi:hypothetical protein